MLQVDQASIDRGTQKAVVQDGRGSVVASRRGSAGRVVWAVPGTVVARAELVERVGTQVELVVLVVLVVVLAEQVEWVVLAVQVV